jgi:hypothetical protein
MGEADVGDWTGCSGSRVVEMLVLALAVVFLGMVSCSGAMLRLSKLRAAPILVTLLLSLPCVRARKLQVRPWTLVSLRRSQLHARKL